MSITGNRKGLFPCCGQAEPTTEEIREQVRSRYAGIAKRAGSGTQPSSCCGTTAATDLFDQYSMVGDNYEGIAGHEKDADLGLGCGIPTKHAALAPGETVVDLGSGAGNDAFVARAAVGEDGRVIGLDFTREMVERARTTARSRGYTNVEFVTGDIEAMPIADSTADIVISNCVLNLVPDKSSAFREMHRIIKPGGRFCISDIVIDGTIPVEVRSSIEAYVGCVAGAIRREEYLALLRAAGFTAVSIVGEHPVEPPDSLLRTIFSRETIRAYRESGARITSVTVTGKKV